MKMKLHKESSPTPVSLQAGSRIVSDPALKEVLK